MQFQRRRAAVLNADVVGYSALMAADDISTVETLLEHWRQIAALVALFGGTVIDMTGDNVLAEFPSESEALRCASKILLAVDDYNHRQPESRRMHFRIGLHSGELLEHEGRLYGDVVNLAARLQSAAAPDGILMSHSCAERAGDAGIVRAGPRRFKNIPYAVPTARVAPLS